MKSILTLLSIFFLSFNLSAQNTERIAIKGKINVNSEDKEGITVYNNSSKNGTTTDEKGEFVIKVLENDVVEFGSLQFQDFAIVIDERIIKSKQVSVRLVEEVNKLDEVIILPYDLSGNLNVDVDAVRTYNVDMARVFKDETDFEDYRFSADNKTKVENQLMAVNKNKLRNGLNVINIYKAVFPKDNSKKLTKSEKLEAKESPIYKRYNSKFLKENFKIPIELTEAFIFYIESEGYKKSLLKKKNELNLLAHIQKQSQKFLILQN